MSDEKKQQPDAPDPRFPQSIEGTRGEKDAARGAREWHQKQRGLSDQGFEYSESSPHSEEESVMKTSAKNDPKKPQPAGDDTPSTTAAALSEADTRGGSLGDSIEDAEKYLAFAAPDAPGPEDLADSEARALTINITGVSSNSQAGEQNAFLQNSDALALVINISAAPEIVSAGHKFNAHFQIIEFATNNVKVDVVTANQGFAWGPNFWISRGNNWGPTPNDYTTPAKWGLGAGLYMFRATVEVIGIGAFSASQELPFRVR